MNVLHLLLIKKKKKSHICPTMGKFSVSLCNPRIQPDEALLPVVPLVLKPCIEKLVL